MSILGSLNEISELSRNPAPDNMITFRSKPNTYNEIKPE